VARFVFHFEVREGMEDRLREVNARYGEALAQALRQMGGVGQVAKYLLGREYVEVIEYDGTFDAFSRALTDQPGMRSFMKEVGACFVQPLREIASRQMTPFQEITPWP
jgi:hypothetical protein